MYHPSTQYKLAKSIHQERLREAEQIRLSNITSQAPARKAKKRFWQFIFTDEFTRKSSAKPLYFAHRKI